MKPRINILVALVLLLGVSFAQAGAVSTEKTETEMPAITLETSRTVGDQTYLNLAIRSGKTEINGSEKAQAPGEPVYLYKYTVFRTVIAVAKQENPYAYVKANEATLIQQCMTAVGDGKTDQERLIEAKTFEELKAVLIQILIEKGVI